MEVNPGSMDVEKISELINRRRRQILVHSIIYYKMDKNLIADNAWSEWGAELEALQAQYAKDFQGFDHSTGYSLPLDDPWAVNKARQLVQWAEKRGESST